MYRYRCPQCRTTSPAVPSRRAAHAEGHRHRADFHGGHHPDGEEILAPARKTWNDLSTTDQITAAVVLTVLLLLGLARLLTSA